MTSSLAEGVWRLPAEVSLDNVAGLYAFCAPRTGQIRCLDLSGVQRIDSAGVALLYWLQTCQAAHGQPPARVEGDPGRYGELCCAHRLAPPDHGAERF